MVSSSPLPQYSLLGFTECNVTHSFRNGIRPSKLHTAREQVEAALPEDGERAADWGLAGRRRVSAAAQHPAAAQAQRGAHAAAPRAPRPPRLAAQRRRAPPPPREGGHTPHPTIERRHAPSSPQQRRHAPSSPREGRTGPTLSALTPRLGECPPL